MTAKVIVRLGGASNPIQLLAVGSLALACVISLAWMLLKTHKHRVLGSPYRLSSEKADSRTGLNAAETGTSSVATRTERIPYDLEKRAILHKRWMMIGHESQFVKPGDYRTYTIADIPFLVIKGRDEDKESGTALRAFHNVCRHRAYTVVRKPRGSSLRLACKYHGWQYDATGRLVKAPEFAGKPGFDFAANGLFRVHLRIDTGRFVFINLATELADAFPWTDISSPSLRNLDFGQGVAEWEIELDVGWRVATLLPWFLNGDRILNCPWPKKALTYLWPTNRPRLQYVDDASFICDMGDGDFLLISALPLTADKSIAKCTYLPSAHPSPTTASLDVRSTHVEKLVREELFQAVAALQRHRMATTALDFQQSAVRERLDKFSRHVHQHRRGETRAGRKINPALRRPTSCPSAAGVGSGSASGSGSRPTAATAANTDIHTNYCPIEPGEISPGDGKAPGSSQQARRWLAESASAFAEGDVDAEAEAICDALDGPGDGATTSAFTCPLRSERCAELE
ncbi:uncharacterized protein PG998_010680, partial [Apiospora kogelbergensis]|uniref:uncharacterized protein n=1 Tax=Apiospora kogelbergensis TaxID=1337665 RepID=UPI003130FCFF